MSTESSAVRWLHRANEAILARDMTAYADLLADDTRFEDRRSGLQFTYGKREAIDQARVIADLGVESVDVEVLETPADHIALFLQTWHVADFEVVMLAVACVNTDGKAVAAVVFDDGALNDARAELEVQSARH